MSSNYAKRMARLSARILGNPIRPVPKDAVRVIKLYERTPIENDKIASNYYPPDEYLTRLTHHLRTLGLYRDEHLDWSEEMERKRELRGKGEKNRKSGPDATGPKKKKKKK